MTITLGVSDSIATITIDRPQKLNALDLETYRKLDGFLTEVASSSDIRAVIVGATGGRSFSAGADINDLPGLAPEQAAERATFRRSVFQRLSELPVPTIAAINGIAFGGGLELALACTFRFANPSSTFGFPELKLGLLPGAGGTQRLPKLVGRSLALELMLTGRQLSAEEARSAGLVDRVVDDPINESAAFARLWMGCSKLAITAILEAVRSSELPLAEGLRNEGSQLSTLFSGPDAAEGIAAFFEKRAPQFNRR